MKLSRQYSFSRLILGMLVVLVSFGCSKSTEPGSIQGSFTAPLDESLSAQAVCDDFTLTAQLEINPGAIRYDLFVDCANGRVVNDLNDPIAPLDPGDYSFTIEYFIGLVEVANVTTAMGILAGPNDVDFTGMSLNFPQSDIDTATDLEEVVGGTDHTDPTDFPPPPNVAAGALDGEIYLTWDTAGWADSYTIYWDTVTGVTQGVSPTLISGLLTPYFTHTGLPNDGTEYFYVVTVVRGADESPDSPEVSEIPIAGIPDIPQGVVAVGTNADVSISWDPVTGADSYTIYMASEPGVTSANFNSLDNGMVHPDLTSSPFTHSAISSLANGTTYYFVVTAVNDTLTLESPESLEVNATPAVPSNGVWDTMIWNTDLWQ